MTLWAHICIMHHQYHAFGLGAQEETKDNARPVPDVRPGKLWKVHTMTWTPLLLLFLLIHCPGVDSQNVVTQEPSVTISSGGTATLTCALSSGSVSTGHYPSWYQQTPGQPPHMIIYNTNSRPSGVPDRFSGSISGNKAALTITAAQPEDEADYYCVLYFGDYTYTVI
ncbi:unnamed protein product [Gulo gulo]|uniref:Ig-like domain-containing protein n=1 Tax=Gulo gulo TaxID=48420 RepID=A0A9X9LPQ6_GULGU|nr:unnamed protein product [Gulo gulo]